MCHWKVSGFFLWKSRFCLVAKLSEQNHEQLKFEFQGLTFKKQNLFNSTLFCCVSDSSFARKTQKNTTNFKTLSTETALIQDACHRPNKKPSGLCQVGRSVWFKNHQKKTRGLAGDKKNNKNWEMTRKSHAKQQLAVSLEAKNGGTNGFLVKSGVESYFFSVPHFLAISCGTKRDTSNSCHLPPLCKAMEAITSDTFARNHQGFDV